MKIDDTPETEQEGTAHQGDAEQGTNREQQNQRDIFEYLAKIPSIFASFGEKELKQLIQAVSTVVAFAATISYLSVFYRQLVYYLVLHPFCSKGDSEKFERSGSYEYEFLGSGGVTKKVKVNRNASHGVFSKNGVYLDTVEFFPTDQEKIDQKERKYLIYCPGRQRCYEDGENNFVAMAAEQNCTVVVFNYPGVKKSTGTVSSLNGLVDSVITQANFLKNQGVDLKTQVVIHGYCMGGTIAAQAVLELANRGDKVLQLALDRVFQSYSHLFSCHLTTRRYFRGILEFTIWLLLSGIGGEINVKGICDTLKAMNINLASLRLTDDPVVGVSPLSIDNRLFDEQFYMVLRDRQDPKSNPHVASLKNLRGVESDKNGHAFFKFARETAADTNTTLEASMIP